MKKFLKIFKLIFLVTSCLKYNDFNINSKYKNNEKLNNQAFDAIKNGSLEDLKEAIENGVSLHNTSKENTDITLEHFGFTYGTFEIIKYLLSIGANLRGVCINCDYEYFTCGLIHKKLRLCSFHLLPIIYAECKDLKEAIQNVIRETIDANRLDIFKFLVRGKCSHCVLQEKENNDNLFENLKLNRELLYLIKLHPNRGFLREILKIYKIDFIYEKGDIRILPNSSYESEKSLLSLSLDLGMDINELNRDGYSFLHLAVEFNKEEILNFLLDKGANVDNKDYNGNTPLFLSLQKRNIKFFNILLEKGASLNHKNNKNNNILQEAILDDNEDLLEVFLEKIDMNSQNIYGSTSLHLAIDKNKEELVDLLLKNNLDSSILSIKDSNNLTPIQLAINKNNYIMFDKLMQAK